MRGKMSLVLVVTAALVSGPARADIEFTGAISNDWGDVNNWTSSVLPDSSTVALIGTPGYPGVAASISDSIVAAGVKVGVGAGGGFTVEPGGSLGIVNDSVGNDDALIIGASGGSSVTVSAAINGSLDIDGYYYVPAESEVHSLDMGGKARANVEIAAGVEIWTAGDIGVGMDGYWDVGYATSVYQGPGSWIWIRGKALEPGLLMMGTFDSDTEPVHYIMDSATLRGGFLHCGGTLEIRGSCLTVGQYYRARTYAGEGRTILKLVGDNALLTATEGLQLRGVRMDVSELVVDNGVWTTVLDGTEAGSGGHWPDKDIDFVPGTDPNWSLCFVQDDLGTRLVQVMYVPEPCGVVLLSLGGIAALLRRRR